MATYDSLHRQCRTLESLFDSKLTTYARMGSSISRNDDVEALGSSERWQDVEHELDDLLEKVGATMAWDRSNLLTRGIAERNECVIGCFRKRSCESSVPVYAARYPTTRRRIAGL